ncbi:BRCA1-A complex subunit RAP80 [Chaetodon trifascialis]|uniref:BRCA1-A complex subunit RAP80 n=1 Tax=Chaetodon trifascialis TaxID=109706 RepID=UPI003992F9E9
MRGRRGRSSSSVSQEQSRMALRKQITKDATDSCSGSQQIGESTQEDEDLNHRDDNDELSSSLLLPSSSREKRKREKENKPKPKETEHEMTEDEMMDLALRLSEQEASITALRLQKEEEAMMKAIQESMVGQTESCLPSQSQSLLTDGEASLRISSRRKLMYSDRRPASAISQGAPEEVCTPETDLRRGAKRSADESNNSNPKRKRKEGSPLLEMPDLSQTQKIYSQASPCSSEIPDLPLDSPQSSDSTQIDDCQLRKSPVFHSTGYRAEVHVHRLSQDLLQTCRASGFVTCSEDSRTSPRKSPPAQPKSPTFPGSPKRSSDLTLAENTFPKSPVFSETDQGDDGETELDPEYFKSPVFGRNTQHEKSPRACKPQVGVCNSGFMFCSQESLTSSVRSTSCRPKSPVFPRSPSPAKNLPATERSATCKSPVFSESDGGQTEQSHGRCTSPVFGRTGQREKIDAVMQKHSVSPSAAELRGSSSEGTSATAQSLRQDCKTDHKQDTRLHASSTSGDSEEKLKEISKDKDSAGMELTSDMTLLWSDEDEDVTQVGSVSPVFQEERPVGRANSQAASLNHETSASRGTTRLSHSRQLLSTTEQELGPISSHETVSKVSAPSEEPAGGSTVHYYWGVPFCPRGLDPDEYTQVILAQMEVYEKSLKQAQRSLLRKVEWGEAILPQPEKSPSPELPAESPHRIFTQRRGIRLRGKKLCDAADTPPAEAEEEEDNKGEEEEEEEERKTKEEEKQSEGGGGQVDTDDCEVCPETQLSDNDDDRTQDLTMDAETEADLRPKSPELPEVEMILWDNSAAGNKQQEEEEEEEVEAPVDRKMKGNFPVRSSEFGRQSVAKVEVEEDGGDPDVQEVKDRGLERSTSPEVERAAAPPIPEASVDCPICQASFSVTEIEMHAAYCDGEGEQRRPEADCFQVSSKPRRKRTRRVELTAEDTKNTVKNQEKCFICQRSIPLRDYSRHTELCIQRQASRTATRGNLLSALKKTDSRDSEAGPSGSKLQPGDVIDLRDDDDDEEEQDEEEGGVSVMRINNSPIRTFTPISEATGCLIDFKKQQRSKKLSQRRR